MPFLVELHRKISFRAHQIASTALFPSLHRQITKSKDGVHSLCADHFKRVYQNGSNQRYWLTVGSCLQLPGNSQ